VDTRSHTPQEIKRWAFERRPHEREAAPEVGERLLVREALFAAPRPAVVAAVQDMSSPHDHWHRHGDLERDRGPGMPDPNVWRHDERQGYVLLDDPWPWVQARVILGPGEDDLAAPRWCREARVRGSAGWLREGSRAHTGNYEAA
jgi:hypothetical protein